MVRPDLPDYESPPLDEVVVGVHFDVLPVFSEAHVGLFWQRIRSEYPSVETRPRLELTEDPFDKPLLPGESGFRSFGLLPTSQRTWFISGDEVNVVQLQNNLLLFNWRRRKGNRYPNFEAVWGRFSEAYAHLRQLLQEERHPAMSLRICEVSYINWISDLTYTELLRLGQDAILKTAGPSIPEVQAWMAKYQLLNEADLPTGRLHIDCQSAARSADGELEVGTQLTLTTRLVLTSDAELSDIEQRALLGRSTIVRAFTDLTTDEAQRHWARTR